MKLHIFDVDFTIVRSSTVRAFLFKGLGTGLVGFSLGFYAPVLFIQFLLFGSRGAHVERAYPFLRGVAREDLETMANAVFADRILPAIDRTVVERIESIRRGGGRIMIASSSFGIILEPLARYLGIEEVVASELEFKDGLTTGRVRGEPAFGKGKKNRILGYLEEHGLDPLDCAFYSDSSHDLPLLRAVGEAVAVNPGRKLHRIAQSEGWEILET